MPQRIQDRVRVQAPRSGLRAAAARCRASGARRWAPDRDRLENLVDNAFKYPVPGDRVRRDLRLEPGLAGLVVQDEGMGTSQQDVAGLFERLGRMVWRG